MTRDGALGRDELSGDVSDRSAVLGETVDDLITFGGREMDVADAIAGQGALDGDFIDIIRRDSF